MWTAMYQCLRNMSVVSLFIKISMKKILYRCIVIWILLSAVAFSSAENIPNSTAEFNDFSKKIQEELSAVAKNTEKKPLVIREKVLQNFCTVMDKIWSGASDIPLYSNTNTKIYYNPKQSVFIHIICAPYRLASNFWEIETNPKTYFYKDDWITLGIYGQENEGQGNVDNTCRPQFDMVNCDIPKVFTEILQRILNDMFDIKQSQLYWGTSQADAAETRLNTFSQNYFVWLELCPDKKCDYPKTENRLWAYFKKAEWLLKKLDIINWSHINKQLTDKVFDCSYPYKPAYNLLVCGFGSQENASLEQFVAMIENEVFFYRLFMAQYMWWIQVERRLLPNEYRDINRSAEKTADIIAKTQQQIAWTQDAVDMSMKSLREMAVTFPIHIGLLIYYEDLYRFRKELVKIVTPLYTLSEKLRNVQKKD